ncbi:uncharacterized protein LOC131602578 [Vicia villosa]|uniref:uncharacterized protein LOC131602578 n=1 Tax=Vicia villosa TaxID=3911 RepID=UPI00273A8F36|nr:uncharacterized protein LOC131602578 [Vicia villosa]
MAAAEEVCSHLPEELLECIFKSLNSHRRTFKSLSVVSKQFLSITNRLRFSVRITDETIPHLPRLFHRFPNLTSLILTIQCITVNEVDALLTLISTFPLDIKSLRLCPKLTNWYIPIPANGLIAFSKTMKNLESLTFYGMSHFYKKDLFLIADCFPLLQELNLIHPRCSNKHDFLVDDNDPLLVLPNLRRINLSGNVIREPFVDFLFHNCKLLQEIKIMDRRLEFGIYGKYDRY